LPALAPRLSLLQLAAVLSTTIGLFLASSLTWLARHHDPTQLQFTNRRVLSVVVIEVAMFALWVPSLRRRGWTLGAMTRPWRGRDLTMGLGLAAATLILVEILYLGIWLVYRPAALVLASYHSYGPLSWWAVAVLVAVNPAFEEALYLGLAATVIRDRYGAGAALAIAVVLRMLVHVYQGPLSLLTVLPVGVLFTAYYLRTRRLWPLILAHAVLDLLALASIAYGST
jgi:membrane protease YdiL (CAAX protease family)